MRIDLRRRGAAAQRVSVHAALSFASEFKMFRKVESGEQSVGTQGAFCESCYMQYIYKKTEFPPNSRCIAY